MFYDENPHALAAFLLHELLVREKFEVTIYIYYYIF